MAFQHEPPGCVFHLCLPLGRKQVARPKGGDDKTEPKPSPQPKHLPLRPVGGCMGYWKPGISIDPEVYPAERSAYPRFTPRRCGLLAAGSGKTGRVGNVGATKTQTTAAREDVGT